VRWQFAKTMPECPHGRGRPPSLHPGMDGPPRLSDDQHLRRLCAGSLPWRSLRCSRVFGWRLLTLGGFPTTT
jgi:hypothetical protein